MNIARISEAVRQFNKNAEVIFDNDEPVGVATDLVLRRRNTSSSVVAGVSPAERSTLQPTRLPLQKKHRSPLLSA
jgi:hypothetical protein